MVERSFSTNRTNRTNRTGDHHPTIRPPLHSSTCFAGCDNVRCTFLSAVTWSHFGGTSSPERTVCVCSNVLGVFSDERGSGKRCFACGEMSLRSRITADAPLYFELSLARALSRYWCADAFQMPIALEPNTGNTDVGVVFFLFESADYLSCVWVDIRLEVIQTNMDTISESLPTSSRSTCRIGGTVVLRMLVFSGTSAPCSKRSTKETRSSSSTRVSVRAISGTGVRRQPFGHDLSLKYRVVSDAAGFFAEIADASFVVDQMFIKNCLVPPE